MTKVVPLLFVLGVSGVTVGAQAAFDGNVPSTAVYVEQETGGVPSSTVACAKRLASRIFADAHLSIAWKTGQPTPNDRAHSIFVRILANAPRNWDAGSMAFSRPFGDGAVTVFYDRITSAGRHGIVASLLAHVLVHELAHVLIASDAHSAEGLMKAHWTDRDVWGMSSKALKLDPSDVALIRTRLIAKRKQESMLALQLRVH